MVTATFFKIIKEIVSLHRGKEKKVGIIRHRVENATMTHIQPVKDILKNCFD